MTRSTSPIIREATVADLPTLLDFEQALIAYERPFAPNLRKDKISYYDLSAYIKAEDIRVVVAGIAGELVGSGYALIKENKAYKAPQYYVYLGFMLDGYDVRPVYYIVKKVREDDFWRDNFFSIHKLRDKNKNGIKYIDYFAEKFGKNIF